MSKRKFYRTTITVEILSEEPYRPDDLQAVSYDTMYGECSGKWEVVKTEELDGPTAANALIEHGSDPAFFGLTVDGQEGWL